MKKWIKYAIATAVAAVMISLPILIMRHEVSMRRVRKIKRRYIHLKGSETNRF